MRCSRRRQSLNPLPAMGSGASRRALATGRATSWLLVALEED